MPRSILKNELDSEVLRGRRNWLQMPVIGMESEFNVWLDGKEINPEAYWKHPSAFIDRELLSREKTSLQLPTGGAVYFDRGVIEVVTPVIELAPASTARMVRNLWEQLGFVRDQLTRWGNETGHDVRLTAYSTHYNISYEIPRSKQTRRRNVKTLALLLAYILPVPVMLVAANRRSTGIGVRPRGNRIEITADFTPDPGLMIATATLVVGIVREVMSWPSYDLSLLEKLPVPVIAGVIPGKHTTRKGWLTKDFHYPHSPYTSDVDAPAWTTQHGELLSTREIARRTAWFFRHSIRRYSDPFSFRLLFAVLGGRAPSMLDLADRPAAYEDVGRLCRWGDVIRELREFEHRPRELAAAPMPVALEQFVMQRLQERETRSAPPQSRAGKNAPAAVVRGNGRPRGRAVARQLVSRAVRVTRPVQQAAGWIERRGISLLDKPRRRERRNGGDRRKQRFAIPFPDRRLTRSAYEQVFLRLVSGSRLRVGSDLYRPVGMKGWYHAVFRRESDGSERILTIDQLLRKMRDWV